MLVAIVSWQLLIMRPIGTRQAARRTVGMQLETREWSSERVCARCAATRMRQYSCQLAVRQGAAIPQFRWMWIIPRACRDTYYVPQSLSTDIAIRRHLNAFIIMKIIFIRRLYSRWLNYFYDVFWAKLRNYYFFYEKNYIFN